METLVQDFRYALRMLFKSPAATIVIVLSLGLGIGANSTIFTLVNAVFFQSLPVQEPNSLMSVYTTDEKNTGGFLSFLPISYPNFKDYRDQNDVFSGVLAFAGAGLSLTGAGEPQQINGLLVSGNYFDVLGIKPALGRTFLAEEDQTPGSHPVVVISHGLWKRQFGSNPGILGKTIALNNHSFTIIGVAPENFKGTFAIGSTDCWVPTMMHDQIFTGPLARFFDSRRALIFNVIGRLKPGTTLERASAAMKTIARRLEREYPRENERRSVTLFPLTQSTINPSQRRTFILAGGLLTTVAGLVLLIACANITNLLLARATLRRREIAIRLSLGASRRRLVRQLLTESMTQSLIAGILGLLLAAWCRDILWAYRPPFFTQNALDLRLDSHVFIFTLALSLLTGILFGLVPALQASRPNLVTELKDRSCQPSRSHLGFNIRSILVVSQIALSVISLIGAGLFLRSLHNAQRIYPGFETEKLLVLSFDLDARGYTEVRGQEFLRQLRERVQTLPGVSAATVASNAPLAGGFLRSVFIEGRETQATSRGILVLINSIGPKYFETLSIPLLRGRDFTELDRSGAPGVAIINETMAQKFWRDQDALGKRFKFFGEETFLEIVGIAKDSKYFSLGEDPRPCIYLPMLQNYRAGVTLHVRTTGNAAALLGTVQHEVRALDANLVIVAPSTVSRTIDQSLWAPRMGAALVATFGLLALLLAAIGIYGLISYSVSQRRNEIGIRMALGAQYRDVLKLVVREGLVLALIGVAIGLASAFALSRVILSLLYGVSASDPITFLGIAALLIAVTTVASYIPARRAAQIDPMIALRYE